MNRMAVVFVHGYMGSVRQFVPLMNLLKYHSQMDLFDLSLPGHDGTISDFKNSNKALWQKCVGDKLAELRKQYDELILVGHSMGGLLFINAAVACPDKVKAIIAIALPLYIRMTGRSVKLRMQCIGKPKDNEDESISAAREMNGVSGVTFSNAYQLLPNTLGLLQVMKETRKSLHRLTVPLTVIHSANDEIVSPKTVCFVQKILPNATIVPLQQATHFWFPAQETKRMQEQIDLYCVK